MSNPLIVGEKAVVRENNGVSTHYWVGRVTRASTHGVHVGRFTETCVGASYKFGDVQRYSEWLEEPKWT